MVYQKNSVIFINQIKFNMALELISRSLLFILEGIVICDSDEHLVKAENPISVTDDGIAIFVFTCSRSKSSRCLI